MPTEHNWLLIGIFIGILLTMAIATLYYLWKKGAFTPSVGAPPLRGSDGVSDHADREDEHDHVEWYSPDSGPEDDEPGRPSLVHPGVFRRHGESLSQMRLRAVPMMTINDPNDSVVFLNQGYSIGHGRKWHLLERCPMEELPGRRFGRERQLHLVDAWTAKVHICTPCYNRYMRGAARTG